jgi:type I restriction enzyme M protein
MSDVSFKSSLPFTSCEEPQRAENPLEQHLRDCAHILRRSVADFISPILVLLFYKRLSDICEEQHADSRLHDHAARPRFCVPEGFRWADVRRISSYRGAAVHRSLHAIAVNQPDLANLFDSVDFADQARYPEPVLEQLLARFDRVRLRRSDVSPGMLGDACEHLREQSAEETNLWGSGFFTPLAVARLMVALIDPHEHDSIYDPVCGSARFLVEACRHLERNGHDPRSLALYGEERLVTNTRLSLLLHGISHATIACSDALTEPHFLEPKLRPHVEPRLRRFDRVLGNPPFSLTPWGYDRWSDGDAYARDGYGCPPRARGDFAFLLHMIESLADHGRMAIIMSRGALNRGSAEQRIRERILQKDLIEAVIELDPKLFVGTTAPVALLLLRRDKPLDRRGKVLLVPSNVDDASGRKRTVLGKAASDRILHSVQCFTEDSGFSRVVTLDELKIHGYNLSVSSYLQTNDTFIQKNSEGTRRVLRDELDVFSAEITAAQAKLDKARQDRDVHSTAILNRVGGNHPQTAGEYPRGWKLVELREIIVDKLTDGMGLPKSKPEAEVLYIRQTQLKQDGFVDVETAESLRLSHSDYSRYELRPNDMGAALL